MQLYLHYCGLSEFAVVIVKLFQDQRLIQVIAIATNASPSPTAWGVGNLESHKAAIHPLLSMNVKSVSVAF